MLPITELTSARLGDVAPGNLVAHRMGDRYAYGLVVRALGHSAPGLLLLEPLEHYPRVPAFFSSNDYCLDLKTRPTVRWSGKPTALSSSFQAISPVGHLAIAGSSRLISGIVPGMVGMGADPMYWDLATGDAVSRPDYATAIYISEWNLSVLDVNAKFQEIAQFKVQHA
jgi:hypothetical protein